MSDGKRFFASLLGIHLSEEPPVMQSLVPKRIANEIMNGKLPKFTPSTILLKQNEICHFMNKAALVVQKKEKMYKSRRNGASYRITKGFTLHSGGSTTKPVEQVWYEYKEGVIFVTNKRIIFVAPENGFEKRITDLTAIVPYTDAIALQFGNQTINVLLPDSGLISEVIRMVK